MITNLVVRIRAPLVRIPLWCLWYPFALIDVITVCALLAGWRTLLRAEFWRWHARAFWIGFDGMRT